MAIVKISVASLRGDWVEIVICMAFSVWVPYCLSWWHLYLILLTSKSEGFHRNTNIHTIWLIIIIKTINVLYLYSVWRPYSYLFEDQTLYIMNCEIYSFVVYDILNRTDGCLKTLFWSMTVILIYAVNKYYSIPSQDKVLNKVVVITYMYRTSFSRSQFKYLIKIAVTLSPMAISRGMFALREKGAIDKLVVLSWATFVKRRRLEGHRVNVSGFIHRSCWPEGLLWGHHSQTTRGRQDGVTTECPLVGLPQFYPYIWDIFLYS